MTQHKRILRFLQYIVTVGSLFYTQYRCVMRLFLVGVFIVAIAAGCQKDNPVQDTAVPDQSDGRITIVNDETKLGDRYIEKNDSIPVDPTGLPKSATVTAISLKLKAEVKPPTVGGQSVQATCVYIKGSDAYVTYNMRGEQFMGGIDVMQLKGGGNATLRSSATFTDTDVNAVDWSDNRVFLAEGTGDVTFSSPASVEYISVKGGKLDLASKKRADLGSFAATSVKYSGSQLYVTTGNTGGLYILDPETLSVKNLIPLADARWVDLTGTQAVVVQGTPGRISIVQDGGVSSSYTFDGATIAESKSTVRVLGGKAIIAAGDGGVKIMNLATGKIVGGLPRLTVAGLDPSLTVTNAVDAWDEYLFISNGEAGVYVAKTSESLNNFTGDKDLKVTLLGKLQFATQQSVNHIAYDGKYLIVAAGLGGVKIVDVKL